MYKVPSQNNTLHTQKLTFGLPWDSDLRNILFPRFIIFNSLISSRGCSAEVRRVRWGANRGQIGWSRGGRYDRKIWSQADRRPRSLIISNGYYFKICVISVVGFILLISCRECVTWLLIAMSRAESICWPPPAPGDNGDTWARQGRQGTPCLQLSPCPSQLTNLSQYGNGYFRIQSKTVLLFGFCCGSPPSFMA